MTLEITSPIAPDIATRCGPGPLGQLVKRGVDLTAATTLLVLLAPVFLALAVLVRCTSRGPAFYGQTRVGRGGREFTVWKFRSMHTDAPRLLAALADRNEATGPLFKMRDDPRVTRCGRWMRRLSLDELPQLINVVAGQMSLVGPRPALPAEVAGYEPHVHRRHLVRPGLTGLWQVSGRSDLDWEEAVRLDLRYVDHWSVRLELSIVLRTLPAVLGGRGAY